MAKAKVKMKQRAKVRQGVQPKKDERVWTLARDLPPAASSGPEAGPEVSAPPKIEVVGRVLGEAGSIGDSRYDACNTAPNTQAQNIRRHAGEIVDELRAVKRRVFRLLGRCGVSEPEVIPVEHAAPAPTRGILSDINAAHLALRVEITLLNSALNQVEKII